MSRLLVVGSGASGVHFALSALERGSRVTLVDVGHPRPEAVAPDATFDDLKQRLPDPVAYFLGDRGQGVSYPTPKGSYYSQPPSKEYVFRIPSRFRTRSDTMQPLFSFARGGLAEAWTAGSYPFNDADLEPFGLRYRDLEPYYRLVATRIGIGAESDDLARFMPVGAGYLEPLPLDPHSAHLVGRYRDRAPDLNRRLRFYLGRSRVATLSRDYRGRKGCAELGRCLWGCPRQAIYSPAATLAECLQHPGFEYRPGLLVRHLVCDGSGRVSGLAAVSLDDRSEVTLAADGYVLAAGTLATAKIVLDSLRPHRGDGVELSGLMDNRQVHIPFLTPTLAGTPVETASYQYHHLAFGIERDDPREYVHGQITTLKAASIHPIVQSLPLDLRGALRIFRATRTGLGVANVNLPDWCRPENRLGIRPLDGGGTELWIRYADAPAEPALMEDAIGAVKRALGRLGAVIPPGLTRVLPKGASVHYAGTLPFSDRPAELTCSLDGKLRGFENVWVADGSTFPFLPAKNLTFTLMANASRIAASVA